MSEVRGAAQDGLAATLSGRAVRVHYDDLLAILGDESLGSTRIYFLRPANRIGNRISAGAGREVNERFADHPVLGAESKRTCKGWVGTTDQVPALSNVVDVCIRDLMRPHLPHTAKFLTQT